MDAKIWVIALLYAALSAINAVAWGYTIRDVGSPELSISFLFKLLFNKYFILAMGAAFIAAVLSYVVLKEMGVLAGRFFLSINIVATILACTLILGERVGYREWIGIALISAGMLIIGKAG